MEENKLKEVVVEIANKENKNKPDLSLIQEILENNDLGTNEKIPEWILNFFESILKKETTERVSFDFRIDGKGDIYNFLAELEDILEIDIDDYGEGIEMRFNNLGMYGFISFEGDTYQVRKLV